MSNSRRIRAYLASPLFNDMEREFNSAIEALLAPYVDVFLPQRDGKLLKKLVARGAGRRRSLRRPKVDARRLPDFDWNTLRHVSCGRLRQPAFPAHFCAAAKRTST